ncbi:MAG: hypothetical protein WCJ24_03355 [Candidatus Saccharibacteria bacterium]
MTTKSIWLRGLIFGQFLLISLLLISPSLVSAAPLSVGYTTTQKLPNGSLVAPDSQQNGAVVAANSTNNSNLLGVVVATSTVSVSQSNSQVQVSTDGTNYVLVSDINGSVKKGDKIMASPLDGIGMKATEIGKVIGTAQGDLNNQSQAAQTKKITDIHGVQKPVLIAMLPITVNVAFYQPAEHATAVPKLLRDVSSSISGKEVPTGRLWASLVVIIVGLLIVIVLLYGAVRSSIGAIGRNPLAKNAIQRSMTKVIGLAIFILAVCSSAVYLILRG